MGKGALNGDQIYALVIVLLCGLLSMICIGALGMSFAEARAKKVDVHLQRVRTRVREHLERQYAASGRNTDGTFMSPKNS